MAGKRYWKIAGYDGEKQTFEKILPAGSLSESQVILLLQRLAAKHLDDEEIVSASLRSKAPGYRSLLEPQRGRGGRRPTISVEAGRTYVAAVFAADELPDHRE